MNSVPPSILLIRLKSLGDVLLTLPAVHAIRDNFPGGKISFLVSKEFAGLMKGFADVDEVIPLDRTVYRRGSFKSIVCETFFLLRRLRRKAFSFVVDLQGYGETAWLSWLAGGSHCWGTVFQHSRAWAYSRPVTHDPRLHPADWHLCLLQQCGLNVEKPRNEFHLPEEALREALHFLAAQSLDPIRPMLYLQPFTSGSQKNWPFEKYLALAAYWRTRGVQVIFSGGPADQVRLQQARALGFTVPTGLSRLADAALMKLSALVVGGDTGFLHWAVSLGRPVVMLMNSKGPGSAVPYGHPEWAVTPPRGLSVAEIELDTIIRMVNLSLDRK